MRLTKEILARAAECPRAAAFLAEGKVRAEETAAEWMNRVFREVRDVLLDAAQEILNEGPPVWVAFGDEMDHRLNVELRTFFDGDGMLPRPGGSIRNLSGRGVERDVGTVFGVLRQMLENLVLQVMGIAKRHPGKVKFGGAISFQVTTGSNVFEYEGVAHAVTEDTRDLYLFEPIGRRGNEAMIVEGFGAVLETGFFDCHSIHGIGILRTIEDGVAQVDRTVPLDEQMVARGSAEWFAGAIAEPVRSFRCQTAFGKCEYQGICRGVENCVDGAPKIITLNKEN